MKEKYMDQHKEFQKIVNSCNWERININIDFWINPIETKKQTWEEAQKILPRKFNRKRK